MTNTTAPARRSVLQDVAEFHRAFGHPVFTQPQAEAPANTAKLRADLLEEEFWEYSDAVAANDVVEVADALADMQYIINGTALAYGIDLDAVHAEVHRSNMSKLGPDGIPILREDGKVLKPETFSPADVDMVLERQDGTHLDTATIAGGAA